MYLSLRPADLSCGPPLWDLAIPAGECAIAVIDGSPREWDALPDSTADELRAAPVVTVGVARGRGSPLLDECDLAVSGDEVEQTVEALRSAGAPALVAAQVLRAGDSGTVALESLAYSTLLWSEDFRHWRATKPVRTPEDGGQPRVTLARFETFWRLTLTRPARHNAFDSLMREQ